MTIFLLGSVSTPIGVSAAGTRLKLDLWYMPVERPYFTDAKSVAEIMKSNFNAVGVDIKLVTYEWGEYLDRTENGDHEMALLGWSADIGDPDNFLYVLLSGHSATPGTAGNIAFYNSSTVTDLLDQAQASFNQTERDLLYQEAEWIIHKDSPWVPVDHSQNLAAYVDSVTGYETHPTGPGANVYANVSKTGSAELIIARGGDSVTLDPAEWTDGQSWKVGRQIYDGLYNLPAGSINPEPALATSYTTSSNGLEWTFNLRQGVKFSDGSDFNASSVVFSFERAKYWQDNTSIYYTNGWTPPEAGYYDYIYGDINLSITEVSNYQVKFTMSKPYAPFLATLGMGVFAIVSPTYVKAHPGTQAADRIGKMPVGTGPYKMASTSAWVPDQTITLTKNPNYWGPAGKADTIIFKVIPEAATRVSELKAGTVDVLDNVAASDATGLESTTGIKVTDQAGMNVGYLAMNALKAPFDNTTAVSDPDFGGMTTHASLVRRAFNYAIDKNKIIDQVFQGKALEAVNPLPPSFWGYNKSITAYDYNPTHAKEILSSLGYNTSAVTAGPEAGVAIVTLFGAFVALIEFKKMKNKKSE